MEWWQERLDQNPVMVMPTAPDAQDMSAEMARRMGALVGQSPALTFTGLVQLVLGGPRRFVGEFQRTVLIDRLLHSVPLEALGAVVHLPGVPGAAGKLLQELDESGKTVEEVGEILGRWAAVEPESAPLAHDVKSLLTEYHRTLRSLGLLDQPAAVREAIDAATAWRRPVALCGFSSFTRGQRALLERLSQESQVLIALTHERGRGVGLCAPGEVEWWSARAGAPVEVSPRTRVYASPALAHLERFFLAGEASSTPSAGQDVDEGVHFLLSSGRRAEAEAVAEQISRLLSIGFQPGGIAVVVRQVRAWGRLLGDVFASCGLPYQSDERLRLGETGLGYAFLQAVRGLVTDDADALLSFLRSPYSGATAEKVCDLEARYRQGVPRGATALAVLGDRGLAEILEPVRALMRPAGLQFDVAAGGALAERMLLSGSGGAAGGSEDLEADASAFRTLQSALASLREHASGSEPEIVLRLLGQATLPAPTRAAAGGVQILSAQRARARRFEAVFVLGLVEGEFPSLPEAPSLLSGSQRAALDSVGGGLLPPDPESDRALFVGAATRAWRLLYLSARDAEDDGSEAVPSRFWTEAKALLRAGDEGHLRRTLADQVFTAESAPAPRHYLRACVAEGRQPASGTRGSSIPAWRRDPERLMASEVLSELASLECFSPSALEAYARCPFAWFIERVVGREEFESELDGRVLGDLIHGVLAECYRSLAADDLLPLADATVEEASSRADALVAELVEGPDCPGTAADRRVAAHKLRTMAHRLFQVEAAAGGSLVFSAAEVRVGAKEGVDLGGIRVRGRIDRIDTASDGQELFVFDYKSGNVPSASALGTGEGLQLPLYLLALGAERAGAQVAGGAYISLTGGTLTGVLEAGREGLLGARSGKCRTLDAPGWQELSADSLQVAKDLAAGMRAGLIAPRTGRVCPDWCDLGPACRSRQGTQRP